MKVLYDHQIFSLQDYGGVSRYFVELMQHYHQSGNPDFELALNFSNNHYLHDVDFIKAKTFLPHRHFKGKKWIIYYLNRFSNQVRLKKQNFDIFHPTYYDAYFLENLGNKPFVLDIHDMIHEIFPESANPMDAGVKYKKMLAQKANVIIAVSENTKKDILKFYDLPAEKIRVLYRGYSLTPVKKEYKPTFNLPEKYVLFVGVRSYYKNFVPFVRSIAPMLNRDKNLHLICAGGGGFNNIEMQLLGKLNISNQVVQREVDDEMIACLYQRALVFVFPSLYEGFGLPVLEALSLGCPTALSNQSSLPEVGGDAAVYFDPTNEESMYNAISGLVKNEGLRAQMTVKGYEHVKKFSWEKSATETSMLYQEVLKGV